MVSLCFNNVMLVQAFIFLLVKDSTAHTDQVNPIIVADHEAENGLAMAGMRYLSEEKEVLEGVPAYVEVTNAGIRKLLTDRRNYTRKDVKKVEDIVVKKKSKNSSASATHDFVGNLYQKGQGELELMGSSHSVKINRGSFMVFSADYHMTRQHPSKNN